MLLSTMSYEEIYCEILKDFRDVKVYYDVAIKEKVCKSAQKSRIYPWRHFDFYTHPKSQNKYTYLTIIKKHAWWNNPEVTVFCEYEGKGGKEIITMAPKKDIMTSKYKLVISVFQAHFFKRYYERFIKDEQAEQYKIALFLSRNAGALQLGSKIVSDNEQIKEDSECHNSGMLNLDGLCLGKISKENPNIFIYKTFIPLDRLYQKQFERVMHEYLRMIALRGGEDNPHCRKTIEDTYNNAARRFHDILLGNNQMTNQERIQTYLEEYNKTCDILRKYIII